MNKRNHNSNTRKVATIYRTFNNKHACPHGIRVKALLAQHNYSIDDHLIRDATDNTNIKKKFGVNTTPVVIIDDKLIGGYDETRAFLGYPKKPKTSYAPINYTFLITFLLACVFVPVTDPVKLIETFVMLSMVILGLMKLRDLDGFIMQFLSYDKLSQYDTRYATVYPFVETLSGLAMLSGHGLIVACPIAFFIGAEGLYSIYIALYIQKRNLKCACVGGSSNVPLGLVSIIENVVMIIVSIWMFIGLYY